MLIEKLLNLKTSKPDTGPRYIQVPRREAGIYVDHDTALQSSAVYACIRVIAEDIASLPWHVYVRRQDGGRDRAAFSPVEKNTEQPAKSRNVRFLVSRNADRLGANLG